MADATPEDKVFGALAGFLTGESARQAHDRGHDVTLTMIARELSRIYGRAAEHPIAFEMRDWADEPFTRGGYAAVFPQGVISTPPPVVIGAADQDPMLDAYTVLRTPHGRVFFAGTETARVNMGYMDGAVESGWRAANDVLAMLG
jgi:monoamine oxidase